MDMQAISLYLCLIKAVVHDQSFFIFGVAKKGDTRKLRLTQQSISPRYIHGKHDGAKFQLCMSLHY